MKKITKSLVLIIALVTLVACSNQSEILEKNGEIKTPKPQTIEKQKPKTSHDYYQELKITEEEKQTQEFRTAASDLLHQVRLSEFFPLYYIDNNKDYQPYYDRKKLCEQYMAYWPHILDYHGQDLCNTRYKDKVGGDMTDPYDYSYPHPMLDDISFYKISNKYILFTVESSAYGGPGSLHFMYDIEEKKVVNNPEKGRGVIYSITKDNKLIAVYHHPTEKTDYMTRFGGKKEIIFVYDLENNQELDPINFKIPEEKNVMITL